MKRKYTPEECDYIRSNYGAMSYRKIGEQLGRGHHSVIQKAKDMGLVRTVKERSAIMSGWSRQPKREV